MGVTRSLGSPTRELIAWGSAAPREAHRRVALAMRVSAVPILIVPGNLRGARIYPGGGRKAKPPRDLLRARM
eukprot:9514798-Alexandrium_andersonii.AAC.1